MLVAVGQMGSRRQEDLLAAIGAPGCDTIQGQPDVFIVTRSAPRNHALITGPDRISFQLAQPGDFDTKAAFDLIGKAAEALRLDTTSVGFQFETVRLVLVGGDSRKWSLTMLTGVDRISAVLPGLSGVGIRLICGNKDMGFDVYVEPFLRDVQKLYVRMLGGTRVKSDFAVTREKYLELEQQAVDSLIPGVLSALGEAHVPQ